MPLAFKTQAEPHLAFVIENNATSANDMRDFSVLAEYWQRRDCSIYNYYCDFSDTDFDGDVDFDDLFELMSYWLEIDVYD